MKTDAKEVKDKWERLQSKAKAIHAEEGCDRTWEVALPVALMLLNDRGQQLQSRWSLSEQLRAYEKKRAARETRRERRRAAKAKADAERAKAREMPMSKKMKDKMKEDEMMVSV